MIIFKAIVAILDIIFFMIFIAFILTLENREIKSNPIATAFFLILTSCFAANTFLIFKM